MTTTDRLKAIEQMRIQNHLFSGDTLESACIPYRDQYHLIQLKELADGWAYNIINLSGSGSRRNFGYASPEMALKAGCDRLRTYYGVSGIYDMSKLSDECREQLTHPEKIELHPEVCELCGNKEAEGELLTIEMQMPVKGSVYFERRDVVCHAECAENHLVELHEEIERARDDANARMRR